MKTKNLEEMHYLDLPRARDSQHEKSINEANKLLTIACDLAKKDKEANIDKIIKLLEDAVKLDPDNYLARLALAHQLKKKNQEMI